MLKQRNIFGFSLIEVMVTTVILTIFSSLTSIAIHHLRIVNRDTKRVADIAEIQTGLEMYYRLAGQYPGVINFGQPLMFDSILVMTMPSNPQPRDDGDCPDIDYTYLPAENEDGQWKSYLLNFCISTRVGDVGPGENTAKPGEIISCIPDCVMPCDGGSDGCSGVCHNILLNCPVNYSCNNDHCTPD